MRPVVLLAAMTGVGLLLSGCADVAAMDRDYRDAENFGHAVREDLAAQIVNPDPTWKGPPPPYSGARTALAQTAYRSDTVKQPTSLATSTVIGSGGP
jgi:type IV pilus biogenesis protein CpaD/CtpE